MMKKLVVLLACLSLAFQLTSCTSKDSQADSEVAADFESADLEQLEGDEGLEIASDESLASDQLPEDALGETTTTTETVTTTTETAVDDGVASTEQTDVATMTETMPADPFSETNDMPEPTTEVATSESARSESVFESSSVPDQSTTVVDSGEVEKPKKANVPLQKVATTPWKSGVWFNTVYFARPGDTLTSISQMIYGSDRTRELKKGNPTFKSREVRPGDKVYYNSPNRPDDSSRMITFFEDNGIAPEVYVARPGDNIRKIAKDLLGYDNAWKEVWSSNAVESKGEISEGTELRFWRGGAVAAAQSQPPAPPQEVAAAMPEMPAVPPQEIPPPPMPEDPMGQQAQMDVPAQPQMEADMEMAPPAMPPEMAQEMAPPPPPVEAINPPAPQQIAEEVPVGMDNETTMALAVVGLAAAGLAILTVIRKKRRQRELEQQAMENTHVGT